MPRQLRIKNLKEKRGAIIQEMNAANEERNFELFNAKDAELKDIENEIIMLMAKTKIEILI